MDSIKPVTAIILIAIITIINYSVNLEPLNRYDLISKFNQTDVSVSQDLVIIKIDDESLKQYNSWPWKRSIYAELLEKLSTTYPKMVALDIDFSSTSILAEDIKFARAIEQAQFPVILPTVITAAENDAAGNVTYVENQPIEILAAHSTLANANASPDETGLVFNYAINADNGRPSLAAALTNIKSNTDAKIWIDYSFDPYTFPTYSVKDILEDNFNPAKIAGKNFIIGSTAIGLGDMYNLPKYRRTAGLYVHALAYETLIKNQPLHLTDTNITLVIAIILLLILVFFFSNTNLFLALSYNFIAAILIYIASVILHHYYQIIFPTSLLYISVITASIYHLFFSLKYRTEKYFKEKNNNNFNKALINHMIIDNSNGIIITNAKGEILVANQKAAQIFSIDNLEIKNHFPVFQFIANSQMVIQDAKQHFNTSQPLEIIQQSVTNQSGEDFFIEMMIKKSEFIQNIGRQGKTKIHELYSFMIIDITEKMNILALQKKSELALIDLKHNDPLTKLPNRFSFNNMLQTNIKNSSKSSCMVVLINVDSAKEIAEVYGSITADEAICQIANLIKQQVGEKVVVARYSEHVFGLIYNHINAENSSQQNELLQQVYDLFSKPLNLKGQEIVISVSMVVALAPQHGKTSETLLNNLMQALEYAMNTASLNWFFYEENWAQKARAKREIYSDLQRAIKKEEFVLYYQPQHNVRTGQLIGYESLIRWQDPHKGLRFPDEFIPVAEEFGLIVEIGELVLKMGCYDAAQWPDHLTVAINVSPAQFIHADMAALCSKYLAETELSPHQLELEITESMMMHDIENVIKTLADIKKLGAKIAMDDFGTGYSSLQYLTQLPFDKIKIDRSFTMNIGQSTQADALITSIISLGHSLDKIVLAEGVETPEMVELLKTTDCQIGQGYHYGKPMPIADVHRQIGM